MFFYIGRLADVPIFAVTDPLTDDYPELSPFQYASNRPIDGIDLDGQEFLSSFKSTQQQNFTAKAYLNLAPPKPKEPEILMADLYGNGHIGPQSVVRANVAAISQKHYSAVADNIAGGPFGAAGYMIAGDKGSFYGAAADGIAMSFSGIPAAKSSVFPKAFKTPGLTTTSVETSVEIAPAEKSPITISVPLNPKWNKEQVSEAYEKAHLITTEGIDVKVNRANTANRPNNLKKKFVAAGGTLKKNQDVDHTQDLILNGNSGSDGKTNLSGRNKSVNRSFGKIFEIQTRNVSDNTRVSGVYVNPFPVKKKN